MSNMAETLAQMGIEIYLGLLCIDANGRISSSYYKNTDFFGNRTNDALCYARYGNMVFTFRFLSYNQPVKISKVYEIIQLGGQGQKLLELLLPKKKAKSLIYHLSASLSCQSNFPASSDHIFAVCAFTDFVLIASVQILSVISVSKPTIC